MITQSAPAFCIALVDFKKLILAYWKALLRQSCLRNTDRLRHLKALVARLLCPAHWQEVETSHSCHFREHVVHARVTELFIQRLSAYC